jgi:rhodanese-related sulfurtransferase
MQDYQSGSINQQRLHQRHNEWNPKLRMALRISGLGIILLLLPIAFAVYNPDILRPIIKAGIPLQIASGLPIIGSAIQQAEVSQITVQELKKLIDSKANNFILIDVRDPEEYAIAQIPGSILVPLGEIEHGNGISKIKSLLKGRKLIAHCQIGRRSAKALVLLKTAGIAGFNLKGGMEAWNKEIDPSISQY